MKLLKRLMNDEEGQGLVEYALIIALIVIACITFIATAGGKIENIWNKLSKELPTVTP